MAFPVMLSAMPIEKLKAIAIDDFDTGGDDSILSIVMYTMDTIGTVGDDSILSIVMYTMDTIGR